MVKSMKYLNTELEDVLVLFVFFMFGETTELKSIKLLRYFFCPTAIY